MFTLSFLATIVAAVIFYQSAKAIGKSKFWWAFVGFVLFLFPGFLVNLLYEKLIWQPVVDPQHFAISEIVPPTIPKLIVTVVGIVAGVLCTYVVYKEFLKPKAERSS